MSRFPVKLEGREFLVELDSFTARTVETLRQQADSSGEFGEHSLNPHDLWRRSVEDWRHGAGQEWQDKPNTVRSRFLESDGVDVWTPHELTLLHDTEQVLSQQDSFPFMVSARGRVWVAGATQVGEARVRSSSDLETWTSHLNFPSSSEIMGMATDGYNVYCALGSHGLYRIPGGANASQISSANTEDVWYAAGRLITASGVDLISLVPGNGIPQALTPEVLGDDWRWTSVEAGQTAIFAAGHAGDTSVIYSIGIDDDGVSLSTPRQAAQLPDGEIVHTMKQYVGFMVLGTSAGIRLAQFTGGGSSLEYFGLVEVGAVRGLEPQGDFVWFTSGEFNGLGRLDLSTFIPGKELIPAYAADLKAPNDAGILYDVVSHKGKRVFSRGGYGVIAETDQYVEEGSLTTGKFTWGLLDRKQLEYLRLIWGPRPTSGSDPWVGVDAIADGEQYLFYASPWPDDTGISPEFSLGGRTCGNAQLKLRLFASDDRTEAPVLSGLTMRAAPLPPRSDEFLVPLVLREAVEDMNGNLFTLDPMEAYMWLRSIERSGLSITFTLWGVDYRVRVDQVQFGPQLDYTDARDGFQGICTLVLRGLPV